VRVGRIDDLGYRRITAVEAVDIESPETLVYQLEKLRRDIRLLDFVRTEQDVYRRCVA